MQSTKDSFYIALRDRLAALNPERTVVVDGIMRPAVLVTENEPVTAAAPLPNAFYLHWGAAEAVKGTETARRPLHQVECRVAYRVSGAADAAVDRGRALDALDLELLQLCAPPRTPKYDYSQTPAVALGSAVFWALPEFSEVETHQDELHRRARLLVFFFPEVDQA